MAELQTQELDVNQPLLELDRPIASPYFEDYLHRIFQDLTDINDQLVADSVTDGANLGVGAEVFAQKDGTILEFRSLIGNGVTINQTDDELEFVVDEVIEAGTVTNAITTWNNATELWTELSQFLVSWASGVATIQVEDDIGALQTAITIDADGELGLFFDGDEVANTRVNTAGGLFIDNQATGAGFERVLTTSDLSSGLPAGALGNTIFISTATDTYTAAAHVQVDPVGPVTLQYNTNDAFATSAIGIEVYEGGAAAPAIRFLSGVGGTLQGNIRSTSTGFVVDNRLNTGAADRIMLLRGINGAAAVQNMITMDPEGAVELLQDGDEAFRTQAGGVDVIRPDGGISPFIGFFLQDGTTRNGFIQANGTNGFVIENEVHGANVELRSEDSLGVNQTLVEGDPDGSVDIGFDGTIVASTTSQGMQLFSIGTANAVLEIDGGGTGDSGVNMEESGITKYQVKWDVSLDEATLRITETGASLRIFGDGNGTMAEFVDGASASLFFDGTEVFKSNDSALNIIPVSSDPVSPDNGDIWYNDTGNDIFKARQDGNTVEVVTRNEGSFTPLFTFSTPGDISVVYTVNDGYFWRDGSLVRFRIDFEGIVPTYTTSSGTWRITGLPYNIDSTNGGAPVWEAQLSKANDGWGSGTRAMVKAFGINATTTGSVFADGVDITSASFTTAQAATTNSISVMRIYGFYETSDAI